MKFIVLFLLSASSFASSCFIVKENNQVLKEEGQCLEAFAPNSTFKIPLAVMGFDSGILVTDEIPRMPFKKEYRHWMSVCKGDHNAHEWMRDSCVWFSQALSNQLGIKRFHEYIEKFNYGNKNIKGKDPLNRSWLEDTLKITPLQQVEFLQRFLNKELSVKPEAYTYTTKVLYQQELAGGWKLYGKTGNGRLGKDKQHGWFVGWIEKKDRKIIFSYHLSDETKQDVFASFRAKNDVTNKLWYFINNLEK